MPFRARTLMDVLDGAMASVLANSDLDDINRGSVIRTILEAAALQDADQYVQIARLKSMFSFESASGEDLDERVADFGITRAPPTQAIGKVKFGDTEIAERIETTLNGLHTAPSATLVLTNGANFPSTGGAVIVERDVDGQRELVPYTSRTGNTLTLTGVTAITHPNLSTVYLSTAGVDRTAAVGTICSAPATEATDQLDFRTIALATILDGDAFSNEVDAISNLTGKTFNVGTAQISSMQSPPWPTATVTNDAVFSGGLDEETDDELRQRVKDFIQALSEGNITALRLAALGVSIASGKRVVSAQVIEEFFDPDVTVYIDDGLGTAQETASVDAIEKIIFPASAGQKRGRFINWPIVDGSESLKRSEFSGTIEVVTPGVGTADAQDTSATFTPSALIGQTFIDSNRNEYDITANTGDTVTLDTTGKPTPVIGAYAILAAGFLVQDVDYYFNETTGDVELVVGLDENGALCAVPNPSTAYTYFTGLVKEVQHVLNGDPADLETYPGVKAYGVKVKVAVPTISNIVLNMTIITKAGLIEPDVAKVVKDALQTYINSLGIGDDVVSAELVTAAMEVPGVVDAVVNTPVGNIVVAEGALARTKASLITLL